MQLILKDVAFAYPLSNTSLFEHISFAVDSMHVAFVGDNGSGKSTLAALCAGTLTPTAGTISAPEFVSYCTQDCNFKGLDIEGFAYDYSPETMQLRLALEIDDEWLWTLDSLSFGQKKRVQLALCLTQKPDLLIVDEPTNHVDAATKQAILKVLAAWDGLIILISHDRELLDAVSDKTLLFKQGTAKLFEGNYSQATSSYTLTQESTQTRLRDLKREETRLAREKQRRKEIVSKSKKHLSNRFVDPKDHSEKAKRLGARVTGKDKIGAEASERLNKRLDMLATAQDGLFVQKRYNGEIPDYGKRSGRKLLASLPEGIICYPNTTERGITVPQLYIDPADHIALIGPNGTGKSTLLSALLNGLDETLPYLYLPQEITQRDAEALYVHLQNLSKQDMGRVLSIVAQLNSEPDRIVGSYALSPGELRKLALALAALDEVEFLLLDEPTNHLDIHSIEALEHFLASFPGAVLLISHDELLCQNCCSINWELTPNEDGATLNVKAFT